VTASLAFLLAYSAGIVALGLWIGRKVRTAEGFFVAGRSLGPGLVFSTMLAANIGGGSTVGATGLGYRDGLAAWWWVGSAAIGSVLLAYWIGPAIHRITVRHNLRTVGDYLEHRYGPSMRLLIGLLLWVGALFILAGQLIALAWILGVVAGVPKLWGCIIGGAVVTTYFAAGGLLTSAWVNMVQLAVKLVGLGIALPFALSAAGGWSSVAALQPTPDYWSFFAGGGSGLVYLAMLAPAFVVSPGLLQKVYGARDARAVRIGVGLNALGLFLYAIMPVVLGMIARVRFPDLPATDLALPTLLMQGVPAAIGSLGLAAVFSAEISAADAVLFMLTTSVARDLYARFLRRDAGEAEQLTVARVTAVVLGVVAVVLAMIAGSVIDALSVFYTLMGVGLFVPMLAGLFVPRATTAGALAATVTGIAAVLAVRTFGQPGPPWMTPAMWGLLVSVVVMAASLAVVPPPSTAPARAAG
jgi:SSS family solute:Na+ symporter